MGRLGNGTGKGCGGVGAWGWGMRSWGTEAWALMVSVLRLSPPPLVTALGTVGEEKRRWSPIHPTPSQHHHRLQDKEPRLDSLSSCVIWVSWPCFLNFFCVFVFLPKTMLLIFTILGCEGQRLFRKSLAPNRGTQRRNYYLCEMGYKAQVHVCMRRGLGVTLLVTDITP